MPFSSASSIVSVATTTPSPIAAAPSNAPAMPALTSSPYGCCARAAAIALAASTGPTPVISTVTSVARPPEGELRVDRAGEQDHGTPMNLCVCSESRKRSGCAFA